MCHPGMIELRRGKKKAESEIIWNDMKEQERKFVKETKQIFLHTLPRRIG